MEHEDKRQYAIMLLQEKASALGRPPKRSDFSGSEVCLIKQKLGPWPRALEAAGLKEPPAVSAAEKSRKKRERMKKLRKGLAVQKNSLSAKDEKENMK